MKMYSNHDSTLHAMYIWLLVITYEYVDMGIVSINLTKMNYAPKSEPRRLVTLKIVALV